MSRQLPAKPNLKHFQKQAKEFVHDFEQAAPATIEGLLPPVAVVASPADSQRTHVGGYSLLRTCRPAERQRGRAIHMYDPRHGRTVMLSANSQSYARKLTEWLQKERSDKCEY
jgi:hypothetical protein